MNKILAVLIAGLFATGAFAASHVGAPMAGASAAVVVGSPAAVGSADVAAGASVAVLESVSSPQAVATSAIEMKAASTNRRLVVFTCEVSCALS